MNDFDRPDEAALRRLDAFAPVPTERSRSASRRPQLGSIDRKRGPDS